MSAVTDKFAKTVNYAHQDTIVIMFQSCCENRESGESHDNWED